eukprot:m.51971 g.51971  ORF g.51971 m.51971 type:complete len:178 (+) comp21526_c0_seq1:1511-2044(+)
MSTTEEPQVILTSSDNKQVKLPAKHAKMMATIRHMLEDLGDDDNEEPIPTPTITHEILVKVAAYCAKHEDDPVDLSEEDEIRLREKKISGWDQEFVDVPLKVLFEMILAANFLDFKPMLNLTCKAVAEMIKGKSPDEVKTIFGIEGDFTDEEKARVLEENPWLKEKSAEDKDKVEDA